jgi:hypothetical protein
VSEPKKRIVVDAVDFRSVFLFPRVLRSVTSAMQPPRLVVALFMVVALIGVGGLWDSLTEPTINPNGLLGEWTIDDQAAARGVLRAAVADYGIDLPGERLDAHVVQQELERRYRESRRDLTDPMGYQGSQPEPMPDAMIRERDEAYLQTKAAVASVTPKGAFGALADALGSCFHRTVQAVIDLRPQELFSVARDLFVELPLALWRQERAFTIIYGLFTLIVLTIGGAALSRMAACEFAGFERLRVREAFDFAFGNWVKLVLTPLLPLVVVGGLAVVLVLLGLVLFLPYLDVIGGLIYGLSILLGFIAAFLLIGYAVGLSLFIPAVACENCDAVEAQQRGYAYVLSRPLHMLGYVAVALVGLALGYVVVALFASTTLNISAGALKALTNNSALSGAGGFSIFDLAPQSAGQIHDDWHNLWAAGLVWFWQRIVIDLVIAYIVSYLFTATTTIYLLMRRAADGQEMTEIWRPGLTPGTLVPLPRPVVHHATGANARSDATPEPQPGAESTPQASPAPREPATAERVLTGALRRATAARFGREGDSPPDSHEGGDDGS